MIYELLALSEVLKVVQQTGTEVRYYSPKCEQGIAGLYRIGPSVDRLVLCPDNQRNHSDLFDTIRHEAIHVVQACKGGPILPYDYYIKNAPASVKQDVSSYPQDRLTQHYELEAHMGAEQLNEQQVVNLINKYCFE